MFLIYFQFAILVLAAVIAVSSAQYYGGYYGTGYAAVPATSYGYGYSNLGYAGVGYTGLGYGNIAYYKK